MAFGLGQPQDDIARSIESYLDATEGAANAAPEPEEAPQASAPAETDDEAARQEEPAEAEAAEAAPAEADEAAGEVEVINTLAELAQSFEVEEQELLDHLQIEGPDGSMVPLSSAIQAFREGPQLDKAFQAEVEKARTELQKRADEELGQLQQLTYRLIQRVEGQKEPTGGWDRLRQENPAEYIRLREQQEAERADARAAMDALERHRAEREAQEAELAKRYEAEQGELLFKLRPDWQDPKAGRAAFEEVQAYLSEKGFTPEQQANLVDARSIVTVWEAAQYRKLQQKKPELRKRLRRLPTKSVRQVARDERARETAAAKERASRFGRLRDTGRVEDAAALFEEML